MNEEEAMSRLGHNTEYASTMPLVDWKFSGQRPTRSEAYYDFTLMAVWMCSVSDWI